MQDVRRGMGLQVGDTVEARQAAAVQAWLAMTAGAGSADAAANWFLEYFSRLASCYKIEAVEPDELAARAIDSLLRHLRLRPPPAVPAKLLAYLQQILANCRTDLLRERKRREWLEFNLNPELAVWEEEESSEVMAEQAIQQLRNAVNGIQWTPSRHQFNRQAVLQILLRVSLANQLPADSLGSDRARWAEQVLPWEEAVQGLQFKSELPSLAQIWTALVELKTRDSNAWTGFDLLKSIDSAAGRSCGLTQDTWYQWSTRCRDYLRTNEPDAWQYLRGLLELRNASGE